MVAVLIAVFSSTLSHWLIVLYFSTKKTLKLTETNVLFGWKQFEMSVSQTFFTYKSLYDPHSYLIEWALLDIKYFGCSSKLQLAHCPNYSPALWCCLFPAALLMRSQPGKHLDPVPLLSLVDHKLTQTRKRPHIIYMEGWGWLLMGLWRTGFSAAWIIFHVTLVISSNRSASSESLFPPFFKRTHLKSPRHTQAHSCLTLTVP